MKLANLLVITFLALSMNISCDAQANKEDEKTTSVKNDEVNVYYFHYSRRCVTCVNLENNAKEIVSQLYGDDVDFEALNLEKPEGESKGKELGIAGQTLLIVNGEKQIDITAQGFMNSKNPGKLKQIMKDKIDPLIN